MDQRQPSPPTARVVDVVETLAGGARLSLTDLASATGMSRATAHAVVGTLVERGWVRRDEDKTYAVGPALALLGRDLVAARPADVLAREAAAKLAADTGHTAVVVERVGDAVVVTEVVAAPGLSTPIAVGSRVPYAPPFGPAFVAWAPEAEQRAWVARAEEVNPALAGRLREVLPVVARRGYSLERFDSSSAAVLQALALLQDDVLGEAVREVLGRVLATLTRVDFLPGELRGSHAVSAIASPVLDASGRVVLNLALQPRGHFSAPVLRSLGESVAAAADAVTAALGGSRR